MSVRAGHLAFLLALTAALAAPASAGGPDVAATAAVLAAADKPTGVRMAAARALGASRNPRALEPLLAALGDENRDVRWSVIEALGELGQRGAVAPLLESLKRPEAYRWAKRLVVDALGAIGDPAAVEPLLGLLQDEDPFVRRLAALAVLRIGDARGVARVAAYVKDHRSDETLMTVRRELARAADTATAHAATTHGAVAPAPVRPHEWSGLRVGATRLAEAASRFGTPLQQTSDFALFPGDAVAGLVRADSVVVNGDAAGVVESIFVYPPWGTLDRDVRALLGPGRVISYGDFLKATGRTAYGAGTKAGGKLNYVPQNLISESYPEMGMLVIYDSAEVEATDRLVKLLIVY